MNIVIDKRLFTAWCGLTASGYDRMDLSDGLVAEVTGALSRLPFGRDIQAYFSFARTDTVAVNPYYPRASELSSACLTLHTGWQDFRALLAACNSPSLYDKAFWPWIQKLPEMLERVGAVPGFEEVWLRYERLVRERFRHTAPEIAALQGRLDGYGWFRTRLCFAPNLLQAKALADFALSGGTLYVISGAFSPAAAVHESLHPALEAHHQAILEIVRRQGLARFVDTDKLLALGYLHGRTEQNQAHALEECLVRALTGEVCPGLDPAAYGRQNQESGFTAVPVMMETLKDLPLATSALEEVIFRICQTT